jgi:hypothetical protein
LWYWSLSCPGRSLSLSLLPGCYELNSSVPYAPATMMLCLTMGPESVELGDLELNPMKAWAKISPSFFKLFLSGILVTATRKPTNTLFFLLFSTLLFFSEGGFAFFVSPSSNLGLFL